VNPQRDSAEIDAVFQVPAHPFLWLVTATLTGAIIMALELVAFRLYAPYFGYSIYVWGSMISVVMLALAVGYALGGWLADRSSSAAILYFIILGSGLYQLGVILVVRPILRWLWQSGEFFGTSVASLIIFVPTMTALAVTSPFVIRLLARVGHIGVTAGRVYALSTAGSIAGVLVTSFFLVPRFGTRMTLQILCALTLIIAGGGLLARSKAALLVLLPALGVLLLPKLVFPPMVLWTSESAYNFVAVWHKDDRRWLALNHPAYAQTLYKEGASWSGFYTDDFALGAALTPGRRMLALGMGAGGGIVSTLAAAPEMQVDAVEIDPKVVEAAARFFDLPLSRSNLSVYIADARPWLAAHSQTWDLVQVDLYQGGPYVPFYLATTEFFGEISSHTSAEGLLMVNVYNPGKSQELLMAMGATLARVFPSIFVVARADGNHIVLAFPRNTPLGEVQQRLQRAKGEPAFQQLALEAAGAISEFHAPAGTPVFTDDRAPIEDMTRRMLLARQQ
jgi:predicted membrane-bound spermidine synthase